MAFVSITRLKVRSIWYLIPFMRANESSLKQLVLVKGFIAGKELTDKGLTFWTLTIWEDDKSMLTFRNSPAHREAMQGLPSWCEEASYFHWTQEEMIIPDWESASTRLLKEGKLTKVRRPSPRQISNSFPPIKWKKMQRMIKPKPE